MSEPAVANLSLSRVEETRLAVLESVIDQGRQTFIEVGSALLEIRESRLYRESHGTFDSYCADRWEFSRQYAHLLIAESRVVNQLVDTSIVQSQARELAPLADQPELLRETWAEVQERATVEQRPVTASLIREVVGTAHVSHNSGDNEWYTPSEYILAARLTMGAIDLDPASNETANANVGARRYFTEQENGLEQHWAGRLWMNPPYATPLIGQFCSKLVEAFTPNAVTQACVLVNNATETAWFHSVASVASAVCFPKGRIRFWHPHKTAAAPLQGQAILYLGDRADAFAREFGEFGLIVSIN